ncbi:(4S)-4-hydroxy-5-phosphonooxypentane-2 [Durusdinium trenchii]|uniref:(4S)-4-hydroxy-5-phosphonooxypentane-2 n=1 Tax=Durusdinium trenchii TaxID=1381693 RepID=A0ABP0LD26_9DINO
MEQDATGSRDKSLDPGCVRFDLLRDRDNPNRFLFYEAYTDDEGITQHKTTPHYKAWADFKASGGVEKQSVEKAESTSLPPWAFQTDPTGSSTSAAVLVSVDIKEDQMESFLKVMEADATNSRNKEIEPGCLRFDLLKDREKKNRFYFYEVYARLSSPDQNDDAIAQHKTTAHYKGWADFKAAGGVEKQEVMKLETAAWKKPLFHSHITQSVKMFSSQGR